MVKEAWLFVNDYPLLYPASNVNKQAIVELIFDELTIIRTCTNKKKEALPYVS